MGKKNSFIGRKTIIFIPHCQISVNSDVVKRVLVGWSELTVANVNKFGSADFAYIFWFKCRGISSTNMNKAKAVEVVEKAMKNDHLMSQPIVDPQYPHFTDKKIMKLRQSGDLKEGIQCTDMESRVSLVSHHRVIIEYRFRFLEKYHQKSPILLIWTETLVV
jgi:hypothetical protein